MKTNKRILSVFLSAALVATQIPAFAQSARASVDLAAGMRQVEEGDFDSAIVTLNRVVKSLAAEKGASKDLARAYLYIGIANLGLSQEAAAKARLLDALSADKSLSLSPDEYPPNVIQLFNQVRREAGLGASAPPPPAREAPSVEKKGGSKKAWIIGGAAAGVGLLALAAGAKKNKAPNAGTLVVEEMNVVPIASLTNVMFRADGASDPDGDSLSYYWEFGDGNETEGGQTIGHVYENAGSYVVTVIVSDGKKESTSQNTVNVKSMTATWSIQLPSGYPGFRITLQQQGKRLTGSYFSPIDGAGAVEEGYISSPRNIYVRVKIPGYNANEWKGEITTTGDRVGGQVTGFTGGTLTYTWTRN